MYLYEENSWQEVTGGEKEPFLKSVNPVAGSHNASAETSKIRWRQLPFYGSIALVEIMDTSWDKGVGPFWFLAKQGRMFHLDGTSAPIHDANESGPIKVTEENALEYLKFFCFFVHGDEGPFFVIEDMNHEALDVDKMDDAMRSVVEDSLQEATYEGKNKDGAFGASALVLYGNALFSAQFSMTEDGMIEMLDDEPVASDIPVKKIKCDY